MHEHQHFEYSNIDNLWPWITKAVISSTAISVVIANNTTYGSKLYIFLLCQKSLDIKIMFQGDILYISYREYLKTYFLISNMHC